MTYFIKSAYMCIGSRGQNSTELLIKYTRLCVEQRLLNSLLQYVFKIVTKQTYALYLHIFCFMGWYKHYTYLKTS